MTSVLPVGPRGSGGPTVYFIRHGETDWNREGRLQGQQDIALNDHGRGQAREAAQQLRSVAGPALERLRWISSPMLRTVETLEIIRHTLGLPAGGWQADDRLREVAFGLWEGLTWKEVRRSDPAGAAARKADVWRYAAPQGESYAQVEARVRPLLESLSEDAVVVAHGGVARAVLVLLAGIEPLAATTEDIWQGRVLVFRNGGAHWTG